MNGARFLAETIHGYGVSSVFFMESILRGSLVEMESLGIRRVLAHSEGAAAYMADGYARASLSPGVCMCQSVGAANLAAGLQDAYLGRSSVVAITGRKPGIAQGRNAYQEIPHAPLFSATTKFQAAIDSVEHMRVFLPRAFREALSSTPRPVHLDVLGLMGEHLEASEADMLPVIERRTKFPLERVTPQVEILRDAAEIIARSQKPIIVAGWGAVISGAHARVAELSRAIGAPVAFSLDGKGIIAEDDAKCVGVVGSYSAPFANQVVDAADLVIFIGCDTGDQATHGWRVPKQGTPVIQIDADASELGRNYPGALGLLGDPRQTIAALLAHIAPQERKPDWLLWARWMFTEFREHMEPHCTSDAVPIRTERLCAELARRLPPDAVVVADTGYSGIWTGTMLPITQANTMYLRAAGSLGWAFPASLGAKCAAPKRPVICFTGDGGFYYHLSELETARRHNIAVAVVVNNNSGFGQCLVPVERVYGDRPGNPRDLTCFGPANFARIAEDFGCRGIRVEQPGEIGAAIDAALQSDRPVVVDVATDPRPRAPAPWSPS